MKSERRIIKEVLAGDEAAFRVLIERYQRLVMHLVFRMVPDDRDREDLCQDVFVKVYRHLGRFRYQSKLSTWIARIAYTTCLNHLKKTRARARREEDQGQDAQTLEEVLARAPARARNPEEQSTLKDLEAFMHAEIERLPVPYRTAVTLYYLEDLRIHEISAVMDVPEGTVKSYLFRARNKLKARLLAKYPRETLYV